MVSNVDDRFSINDYLILQTQLEINVDEGRHIMFPIFIYALCMQFSLGYLHSSAVTSYKDALALSHMQF